MTTNEKLVARIDAALANIPESEDDYSVLHYIRNQISPEGMAARSEWDQDVKHLVEIARDRLRAIDKKEHHTS